MKFLFKPHEDMGLYLTGTPQLRHQEQQTEDGGLAQVARHFASWYIFPCTFLLTCRHHVILILVYSTCLLVPNFCTFRMLRKNVYLDCIEDSVTPLQNFGDVKLNRKLKLEARGVNHTYLSSSGPELPLRLVLLNGILHL